MRGAEAGRRMCRLNIVNKLPAVRNTRSGQMHRPGHCRVAGRKNTAL